MFSPRQGGYERLSVIQRKIKLGSIEEPIGYTVKFKCPQKKSGHQCVSRSGLAAEKQRTVQQRTIAYFSNDNFCRMTKIKIGFIWF